MLNTCIEILGRPELVGCGSGRFGFRGLGLQSVRAHWTVSDGRLPVAGNAARALADHFREPFLFRGVSVGSAMLGTWQVGPYTGSAIPAVSF